MKIKGFNENLCCRGMQFEIGKEYKIKTKKKLELCTSTVFHYCNSLRQVHEYYDCDVEYGNRFCEIEVLGEEVSDEDKCGSNHIKIVREIVGDELEKLRNTGYHNIGVFNNGEYNIGSFNIGNKNVASYNKGYCNTGIKNYGDGNVGVKNRGHRNVGSHNAGSGNTGYDNKGNYNTGNNNLGHYNSGDWNKCDYSNGFFNTVEPTIYIFNKDSGMTYADFVDSKYYDALRSCPFVLTEWVYYKTGEKETGTDKALMGGYLKVYSYEEACKNWWDGLPQDAKEIIMQIPNFDKEIFKEITGIDVDKGVNNE